MRTLLLLFFIAASAVDASDDPTWEAYKKKFSKQYVSDDEEERRHTLFNSSLARADGRNKASISSGGKAVFGQTKYSDRTDDEFKLLLGRKAINPADAALYDAPVANASTSASTSDSCVNSVDWRREQGVVSWVKDQGQCGSCWSFSVAETVESQMALAGFAPMQFAPQQIAANTPGMYGCGGGNTAPAYHYIMNKYGNNPLGGLASEHFCPYTQSMWQGCSQSACTNQCDGSNAWYAYAAEFPVARLSGFMYATKPCYAGTCVAQDLEKLRCNVAANGPTSICVNAGAWNDYTGGILTASACGGMAAADIDHCVQLVGYHKDPVNPADSYWLVRNSWSTNWGEDGYIRLQLDANTCGLANEATIPTIAA